MYSLFLLSSCLKVEDIFVLDNLRYIFLSFYIDIFENKMLQISIKYVPSCQLVYARSPITPKQSTIEANRWLKYPSKNKLPYKTYEKMIAVNER